MSLLKTPVSLDLAGRVALITGANSGIGRITALRLAELGVQVVLACRSRERGQVVVDEIARSGALHPARLLPLDLGDLDSVQGCAQAYAAWDLPLHLLILNAGVAGARGLSASGFELAFGINHVGHFLLTQLLLPQLRGSAPARVVTVASRAHQRVAGIDWDSLQQPTASITGIKEYSQSKLANVLFSAELGRRLQGSGVVTSALHPGVIASDIWRHVPWPLSSLISLRGDSVEQGARTTLYCATAPELAGSTGLYYSNARPLLPSPAGQDKGAAAELWRRSLAWTR